MNLYIHYPPVDKYVCVVMSEDGSLYWKMADILKFFNYKDTTRSVTKLFPNETIYRFKELRKNCQSKAFMFTTAQLKSFISKIRKSNEVLKEWFDALTSGMIKLYAVNQKWMQDELNEIENNIKNIYLKVGDKDMSFTLPQLQLFRKTYVQSKNFINSSPQMFFFTPDIEMVDSEPLQNDLDTSLNSDSVDTIIQNETADEQTTSVDTVDGESVTSNTEVSDIPNSAVEQTTLVNTPDGDMLTDIQNTEHILSDIQNTEEILNDIQNTEEILSYIQNTSAIQNAMEPIIESERTIRNSVESFVKNNATILQSIVEGDAIANFDNTVESREPTENLSEIQEDRRTDWKAVRENVDQRNINAVRRNLNADFENQKKSTPGSLHADDQKSVAITIQNNQTEPIINIQQNNSDLVVNFEPNSLHQGRKVTICVEQGSPVIQQSEPSAHPNVQLAQDVNTSLYCTDASGKNYEFRKVSMNWNIKEDRPINIVPTYKIEGDQVMLYYPVKLND